MGFRRVLIPAVRLVTYYSPVSRGKRRLMNKARPWLHGRSLRASSRDGRRFRLSFPEDRGWETIYFLGDYEVGTTRLFREILRPDDVIVDIGANIGWYTSLSLLVARSGTCHAFEPNPRIFSKLADHLRCNRLEGRAVINRMAIGDRDASVTLHQFSGLPHGHASISALGRDDAAEVVVPMTTLDRYVEKNGLERIDLVKLDVEGAELMVLRGAEDVLERECPPMWIVEINYETARAFDYSPEDLLGIFERRGYRFWRVEGGWGELRPMRASAECRHGDNVLCALPAIHGARLRDL